MPHRIEKKRWLEEVQNNFRTWRLERLKRGRGCREPRVMDPMTLFWGGSFCRTHHYPFGRLAPKIQTAISSKCKLHCDDCLLA